MWAAGAIIAAGATDPARAAALYERDVRRDLVPDHRAARRMMRVLASAPGARGAVRVPGITDWTSRNFARWLFEDYPRAMLLTPHRWHRGMFTGPGAFRSA
jgi:hypothetical protein